MLDLIAVTLQGGLIFAELWPMIVAQLWPVIVAQLWPVIAAQLWPVILATHFGRLLIKWKATGKYLEI